MRVHRYWYDVVLMRARAASEHASEACKAASTFPVPLVHISNHLPAYVWQLW